MREARHFTTDFRGMSRQCLSLVLDPNRHTRLEACRLSLRVEAQAKRVAVMIPNNPLGLPGGERSERPQFGDDAFDRAISTVPLCVHCFSDREVTEMVFAHIEREPLLARRLDHQDRLTRANILAHLCGDDADQTVGRSAQEPSFQDGARAR